MKKKILKAVYLTYNHAKELYEDAEFLLENGKKERAYTFYHFSFEESGRFFILLKCIFEYLTEKIEPNKLNYKRLKEKGYEDHIKKLEESVLKMIIAPLLMSDTSKYDEIEEIYNNVKNKIPTLNDKKNQSIYIDFYDNEFKNPSQNISENDLLYIKDLAEIQLLNIGKLLPFIPKENDDLNIFKQKLEEQRVEREKLFNNG